jgi:hypothetical protein
MTTKSEDRLRLILDDKQKAIENEVISKVCGIFLW